MGSIQSGFKTFPLLKSHKRRLVKLNMTNFRRKKDSEIFSPKPLQVSQWELFKCQRETEQEMI